jgi:hypothetical protein
MTKKIDYRTWDRGVMAIEEVFAAYTPELREKLKDQLITSVDRSEGGDEQKEQAKDVLDAAFSNVSKDAGIEEIKWLGDQVEIANRLHKLTGILFAVDDFETRGPKDRAVVEEILTLN